MDRNKIRAFLAAIKNRLRIILKKTVATALGLLPKSQLISSPAVTLFISSLNTRFATELTLKSLIKYTNYPNYQIWVGDNASTDGSLEFLEKFSTNSPVPFKLIKSAAPKAHSQWLDEITHSVSTPYVVVVDSDMLFLGKDWLYDMINVLEKQPELYFVAAEKKPLYFDYLRPETGQKIDLGEAPSSWLFALRTTLWDKINTSFAFAPDPTRQKLQYDTGGKLLLDMRQANLKYAYMPRWFFYKYHHFGSMSWNFAEASDTYNNYLRQYRFYDVKRRCIKNIY